MACPLSEARLLAVYFEEVALKHAEDNQDTNRRSPNTNVGGDFDTDETDGGYDELDWYEASKEA